MVKKADKKNLKVITVVILLAIACAGALFLSQFLSKQNLAQKAFLSRTTKEYTSKFFKLTFAYPNAYILEDTLNRISLTNSRDQIIIDSNGTNYQTIDEYVNDLSHKNNFVIIDKEKININGKPAIRGYIDSKKYYFIYPYDWTIITVSTKSKNSFEDLDHIAASFRYEPAAK